MKHVFFILFVFSYQFVSAQHKHFTHEDTLRGSITPERQWWDLTYYNLQLEVFPDSKTLAGKNTVHFTALEDGNIMQIDLQSPLKIERVLHQGKELSWESTKNAHFVKLDKEIKAGEKDSICIEYSGKPQQAKRAPWDGGLVWNKDKNGNEFIATACQGIGASIWWPCKDHMYDEPDFGMTIGITVPSHLTAVSNGRLIETRKEKGKRHTFIWKVVNPINNYGVNVNIGDYVNFSEVYEGEKGKLDMSYWVLADNLEKAKEHFKQAPMMMQAFEHWFGPYPFYEDSYKIVEVPYLGMEHQSSVTYGNHYKNGYLGADFSGTGWGLKFDYLIVHESGHEWFANNITYKDIADMWIHESFTTYSESLFLEYHYGKEAAAKYIIGTRGSIGNKTPIIGIYDVNHEGDGDMYTKGANIIHTLRQFVPEDEKWREILRGMNSQFYHKTVTTKEIEDYLSDKIGMDLKPFFDQYLREAAIPTFEFKSDGNQLLYRWANCNEDFNMPIDVVIDGQVTRLYPKSEFQAIGCESISTFSIDPDFYVKKRELTEKE